MTWALSGGPFSGWINDMFVKHRVEEAVWKYMHQLRVDDGVIRFPRKFVGPAVGAACALQWTSFPSECGAFIGFYRQESGWLHFATSFDFYLLLRSLSQLADSPDVARQLGVTSLECASALQRFGAAIGEVAPVEVWCPACSTWGTYRFSSAEGKHSWKCTGCGHARAVTLRDGQWCPDVVPGERT